MLSKGSESSYNLNKVRSPLIEASKILSRYGKMKFCPGLAKRRLWDCYWEAYIEMYSYIYKRVAKDPRIDECDRDDICSDLFPYLVGGGYGFFRSVKAIICNPKFSGREKYLAIQRLLDKNIFMIHMKNIGRETSWRVIEEDFIDPTWLEDLTIRLNPEDIALMRCERERVIDLLLTPPRFCRIDVNIYKRELKEYLKELYGIKKLGDKKHDLFNKFNRQYVMFCVRKVLETNQIKMDDIYNKGIFDAYLTPTFSQMLADRLEIKNPILEIPAIKNPGHEVTESGRIEALKRYSDYDRNHQKFLISD